MLIRPISDLHLEHLGGPYSLPNLEKDKDTVLILAGDIGSPLDNSLLKFLEEVSARFKAVVYVFGNHEYYGGAIPNTLEDFKEKILHLGNVRLLDDDYVDFTEERVRVIGSTYWTDCGRGNLLTGLKIKKYMHDYHAIKVGDRPLRVDDTISFHTKAKSKILRLSDSTPEGWKKVLVTHHGVSYKSVDPKYGFQLENYGFISEDDDFIGGLGLTLLVHGHVHTSFSYLIGGCCVIVNPRGYPNESRTSEESKHFTLEI